RSREVSTARQVVSYIAREEADIPLNEIGDTLGGRNHSTVLYSIERVNDLMQTDSLLRRQVEAILNSLSRSPSHSTNS
ncbi:MAG: chromosomal replication initiator protein DnaA, partial [Chloroflexi bacterium]|nr:chromosomal replication initiator protein DnaA [Chloroflexota bacterium]